MIKIVHESSNIVKVAEDGALLVEGIEKWIDQLTTELYRFVIRRVK